MVKLNNLGQVLPDTKVKHNSNVWGQNEGKEIFPTANFPSGC